MESKKPILTVAIPAYNVEKYIDKTINSLVKSNQCDCMEVLIVDDGSTDATKDMADALAKKYDFVKAFHQENGGHGAAINTGIREAQGKYFKLLDGDDWVNPEGLAQLITVLDNIEDDFVLCDFHEVYMKEKRKKRVSYSFEKGRTLPLDDLCVKFFISMHSFTFRTEILKKLPKSIDCHSFYVDMEYMLYPLPFVRTFRYEAIDVYQYRLEREGQSVSAEGFRKHHKEDANVLWQLIDYYNKYGTTKETAEAVQYYMTQRIFDMYYRHILKSIWFLENQKGSLRHYLCGFDEKFAQVAPDLYDLYQQKDEGKKALTKVQLSLLRKTKFAIWPIVRCKKEIENRWKKKK